MNTLTIIIVFMMLAGTMSQAPRMEGAWVANSPDGSQGILILADGHYAFTSYDLARKTFEGTRGGKFRVAGDKLIESVEFNTLVADQVGTEQSVWTIRVEKGQPVVSVGGVPLTRLDDGTPGKLAGAWVITGRVSGGSMRTMTPGARRTMKILSGTRFQWIAYNVETKEFSGTGGGTYSTVDGKYTEQIEFFSRDNSRVGASLTFDFAIEGTAWRHKGLSSKGEPIDEVWTRRTELGL